MGGEKGKGKRLRGGVGGGFGEKAEGSTQQIHFFKQNMCFASTSGNRIGASIV